MFTQTQNRMTAGNFENEQDDVLVTEDKRIQQMGFEGKEMFNSPNENDDEIKDIDPEKLKQSRIMTSYYALRHLNLAVAFDPSVTYPIPPASDKTALDVDISSSIKPEFHPGIENLIRLYLYDHLSAGGTNYSYSMALDYSKINYSTLSTDTKVSSQLQTDYGTSTRGLRFTYEKGETGGKPKIHAEDIGLIAVYKRPDEATKLTWQEKFDKFQLTFSDENGPWQEEEKELTMKSIYNLPDAHLESIKGTVFKRDISEKKKGDNEAANYNTTGTLTVKNWAFADNPAMYGNTLFTDMKESYIQDGKTETRAYTPATSDTVYGNETDGFKGNFEKTIVHEIGHAVDQANLEAVQAEYQALGEKRGNLYHDYYGTPIVKLKTTFGNRVTVTSKKDANGKYIDANVTYYASDTEVRDKVKSIEATYKKKKDAMQLLIDAKKTEFENTYSESGGRKGSVKEGGSYGIVDNDPPFETEFQKAVKADGGQALTDYAQSKPTAGENALEHFAETYSLYMNDRERFKLMRPNLFIYFSTNKLPSERKQ